MLLFVYRSVTTVILLLVTVGFELVIARGAVAVVGHSGFIGLSTFAVSLLTSLAIAAGTDYGIFIIGRYQEARQAGEDKEAAFYTMYRGTAHVILGSGLTIAGATFCLSFARSPYFKTLGIPVRGGHGDRGPRRPHAGAGGPDRGRPIRCLRPQAEIERSGLAPRRYRGGSLAAAYPRRQLRRSPRRPAHTAWIQAQLRRPGVSPQVHPRQSRLRGRGSPLFPGPNEARDLDDRSQPRHAQSDGLPGLGQTRQGHLPGPGDFARAGDHPARRNHDGPHVDPVSDEHAKRRPDARP